jgi:hypothetical protein
MARLTPILLLNTGRNIGTDAVLASALGDKFTNTGREFLYVTNLGSTITLTVKFQRTVDGQVVADREISVTGTANFMIGPFDPKDYNDPNGDVVLSYSGVASVTVAVYKVPVPPG